MRSSSASAACRPARSSGVANGSFNRTRIVSRAARSKNRCRAKFAKLTFFIAYPR